MTSLNQGEDLTALPVAALSKSLNGIRCWGEFLLLLGFKLEVPSPSSSENQQPTLSFPSSDPLSQLPTAVSLLSALIGLSHRHSLILSRLTENTTSASSYSFLQQCLSALNRCVCSSSNSFQMTVSTASWNIQGHKEMLTSCGFSVEEVQTSDADSNLEGGSLDVRFRSTDVAGTREVDPICMNEQLSHFMARSSHFGDPLAIKKSI